MEKNHRLIQSLQRAGAILDCFDTVHPKLKLWDIANMLNLNINTTRGLVNTLVYLNYLSYDEEDGNYFLGYAFIPKANLVEEQLLFHTKNKIKPFLKILANEFQMSTRLQMVASAQLITIYTEVPENSRYLLMTRSRTPFPLHATSSGKLYLAYLDKGIQEEYVRETNFTRYTPKTITNKDHLLTELRNIVKYGYALELGEINEGIGSIAFPLLNSKRLCYGTISLSAATAEIKEHEIVIVERVKRFITDSKISEEI